MSDPASGKHARPSHCPTGCLCLCLYISLSLSLLCGCGLFTHRSATGPQIKIEKEVWDFGTIARGDTARAEIEVENTGSDSLRLSLNISCTCLSATVEPAVVPPHMAGRIMLVFAGDAVSEATSKTLFIDSNDPTQPRLTLTARGRVTEGVAPHLVVTPDPLPFEEVAAPQTLTVANVGGSDLVVREIRCVGCSTDWTQFTLAREESAGVSVTVIPDWKGMRWIEIESNDPVTPLKKVSMVGIN